MTFDALPAAPVFPGQPLAGRVELLLGSIWTDVTPYALRDPLTISRGHPDESTTTSPSALTATLANDGRFTSRNPAGPYYGQLGLNVPIRVSVPEGASYLRSETDQASYASCPDTAGVSITGDTEIQLDVTLDNWSQSQTLAAKYAQTGNQRSWLFLLNENGTLSFLWSSGGGGPVEATSTAAVPLPALLRMCLRVTLAVATGTVTFYTATPGLTGVSWTQLGAPVVIGAVSVFNSTAPVQLGYCTDSDFTAFGFPGFYGKIHAFLLLSGIGGTAKASPDFTAQAAGTTSFADAQGNTWTVGGNAEISDRKYRAHAECAAFPQFSDPGGRDVMVTLAAGGLLRRLSQRNNPVNSAMYRAYVRLTGPTAPVAYWPAEDGVSSTQIASGLGQPAMQVVGPAQFASNSDFAASAPIPVLNGSTWTGSVLPYTGSQDNVFRFLMEVPSGGDTNGAGIARMYTTGTVRRIDLVYLTGGALELNLYDVSQNLIVSTGPIAFGVNGQKLRVSVELQASGANLLYNIVTLVPGASSALETSNTLTSASVGLVTQVQVNPGGLLTQTAVGQMSVQPAWDNLFNLAGPLQAWQGETAGNRFQRLCGEEGVPFRGRGSMDDTQAMGPQSLATLVSLLQECVDADRGAWTEPRQVLGWGYRTRVSMGNQAAAVPLDYHQDHLSWPVEPTQDDQTPVNDVTVTQNADGSFARQVLTAGTMSVNPPPAGIGRYDSSVAVNLATDAMLGSEAGWILHMSTVDEPRYPSLPFDLANKGLSAALYYAVQDADLGDRLTVANPPAWLPPGLIDQLLQATSETIFTKTFTESWTGVPASPYNVGYADDAVFGHADTDGSVLHANVTSGATSMQADTAADDELWSTSSADYPVDILMSGERITVTAVSGASSPQTLTVTRSVNGVVKAQTAGTPIVLFQPSIVSL